MASPATETPASIPSDALTINEAAETTGWSPRMLRYIESVGLVVPPRSGGGYRLYGPGELQRLRTLRELLKGKKLEIADVGFMQRLRDEPEVDRAVNEWLDQTAEKPAEVSTGDWLSFEQQKHQQLLNAIQSSNS
ncbi:MAG: MerR family transcriptional regulator [Solirubrobacterales bacterium]